MNPKLEAFKLAMELASAKFMRGAQSLAGEHAGEASKHAGMAAKFRSALGVHPGDEHVHNLMQAHERLAANHRELANAYKTAGGPGGSLHAKQVIESMWQ